MKIHLQVLITCNYENQRKNIKPYLSIRKFFFERNHLTCLPPNQSWANSSIKAVVSKPSAREFSKINKDRESSASLKNLSELHNNHTEKVSSL